MSAIYDRIKTLCKSYGITVKKLEEDLGFGHSSINKWESLSSPSIDKVIKVATYFNVSVDYLLGKTDYNMLADDNIISFHRAYHSSSPQDQQRMMDMLHNSFAEAFKDDFNETD